MKILLVEDDPVIGLLACEGLKEFGHDVRGPAFNAKDAILLAEAWSPDIAFVDVNLEGNDEGIQLARDMQLKFRIPSVFVSGQSSAARNNVDAALGFLPKPYSIEDLEQSALFFSAVIGGKSPPPPHPPLTLEIFARIG